ncbi:MarR family winged helix-turn-helix transcriptional regulator [Deinococcus malanensis]|uniref:MarR family winged helix-turn-helix transcriptional regulator n=1 Tax=Deinococcus malanensis TaxID=1706855 RepID=UPI001663EFC1|nr:MarR family transcriptional regulator [Deinococcus malanensis]
MQDPHQVTLAEYEVLLKLARAPERQLRLIELAEASVLTLSGLSRLVDRLEQRQFVERVRNTVDRRSFQIHLTPQRHTAFQPMNRTHLQGVRGLFLEHFTEEEQYQLGSFWHRLLGHLDDELQSR